MPYFSRKASLSGSTSSSPVTSPQMSLRRIPPHSPSATPPGSPSNVANTPWKSRLHTIKNNFLGSPRFHRRKLQGTLMMNGNIMEMDYLEGEHCFYACLNAIDVNPPVGINCSHGY